MQEHKDNYAFIDSQNLHLSIRSLGWTLDYKRLRIYLRDKYAVSKAFLFIGFIGGNNDIYSELQDAGFICIFKPTLKYKNGTIKGNCDADLVLRAMVEINNFDKAVLVTGDGDFYCLVKYFIEQGKLEALMIPNEQKFSALLRFKICRPYLRFMNNILVKVAHKKEKTP